MLKAALQFERNGGVGTGRPLHRPSGAGEGNRDSAGHREARARSKSRRNFVLAGPWQMPQSPETYGLKLSQKIRGRSSMGRAQDQTELIAGTNALRCS